MEGCGLSTSWRHPLLLALHTHTNTHTHTHTQDTHTGHTHTHIHRKHTQHRTMKNSKQNMKLQQKNGGID